MYYDFLKQMSFVIFTDRVTEVKTDIYVTSFGPVSDTDMVSLTHLTLSLPKTTHTQAV